MTRYRTKYREVEAERVEKAWRVTYREGLTEILSSEEFEFMYEPVSPTDLIGELARALYEEAADVIRQWYRDRYSVICGPGESLYAEGTCQNLTTSHRELAERFAALIAESTNLPRSAVPSRP